MRRLGLLIRAPFEAAIAFAAFAGLVSYLIDPRSQEATSIGHTAKTLVPYWITMYGIGGLLILAGLLTLSLRVEVAGLAALLAALLINSIAIVHFAGVQGFVAGFVFAALAAACVGRITVLLRGYRRARRLE